MTSSSITSRILSHREFKKELLQHSFTILVFYRTVWCGRYLSELHELSNQVTQLGGHIIAVSSQNLECTRQQQLDWRLKFDVYVDDCKELAEKYDMVIDKTETQPTLFSRMSVSLSNVSRKSIQCIPTPNISIKTRTRKSVNSLRKSIKRLGSPVKATERYSELSKDGYLMPGIVILKQNKTVFKWRGVATGQGFLATFSYLQPQHIVTAARLHFDSTIDCSRIELNGECGDELFNYTLHNPDLKALFRKFLELECSSELMDFMDGVQQVTNSYSDKKGRELYKLYSKYIVGRKRQINLESKVKQRVMTMFESEKIDNIPLNVFDDAIVQTKLILRTDPFRRFLTNYHLEVAKINPAFFLDLSSYP
jgi:hypothetical protein